MRFLSRQRSSGAIVGSGPNAYGSGGEYLPGAVRIADLIALGGFNAAPPGQSFMTITDQNGAEQFVTVTDQNGVEQRLTVFTG